MYTLTLKKGEEKRILAGHPWVCGKVLKTEGHDEQGSIARCKRDVLSARYISIIQSHCSLTLTRDETPIDKAFFSIVLKPMITV